MLSSLVHSILHRKRRAADEKDANDDCSEDEIVASSEVMLRSLVERMVKCEPEDFELVRHSHCSHFYSVYHLITRALLVSLISSAWLWKEHCAYCSS